MKEEMDIILSATDNASSTFEAVEDAAKDLGNTLENVGDEGSDGMDELGDGADKAEDDVRELGDEAQKTGQEVEDLGGKSETAGATMQMAFQNIADGVMRAKEGIVELGHNLMEALDLAGQQEQQETFLKMSIGTENAAKQMKIINDLVADLPGDDVAIGGLLSQATAKNATITADELERMGTNAADYFAAMSNYGKSSVEAQQDLVNYIMQGNTAELERSPVLQAHIDKLKEANTIEERNKALQEALTEEGWAGISQQDTYNNKLETFTAMLDRGKRQMGEMFLSAASGAMDFIGDLDQATGGVVGMGIGIAGVAGGPMIEMITGVGQMATGLKALQAAYEGTAIATAIAEGGFWSMAAAELAALWPILAIIAAVAVLVVAVYEVGKYFGLWEDFEGMLNVIWVNLTQVKNEITALWAKFMSSDIVGSFENIRAAFYSIIYAVGQVIQIFNQYWNGQISLEEALIKLWQLYQKTLKNIFNNLRIFLMIWMDEIKDHIIKGVKKLITDSVNNIRKLPSLIASAIRTLASILAKPFIDGYTKIKKVVGDIIRVTGKIANVNISGLTSKLTQPFVNAYNQIAKQVDKIKAKASQIASNPLGALGFGFDIEGMLEAQATTGNTTITQDINLNVDLSNVPANIDTQTLIAVLTDPTVLAALTGNNNFQTLDSRAKNRLNLKTARAGGL